MDPKVNPSEPIVMRPSDYKFKQADHREIKIIPESTSNIHFLNHLDQVTVLGCLSCATFYGELWEYLVAERLGILPAIRIPGELQECVVAGKLGILPATKILGDTWGATGIPGNSKAGDHTLIHSKTWEAKGMPGNLEPWDTT